MKSFHYIIQDKAGIHARTAGLLVKKASQFESRISIINEGKSADVKKLLELMSLGVKKGHKVVVTAEGMDEKTAITELKTFVTENM